MKYFLYTKHSIQFYSFHQHTIKEDLFNFFSFPVFALTSQVSKPWPKSFQHGYSPDFVKLHSELANPTEFQLDGVGVDFVFLCHNKKEGRRNNPHLASNRRNGPICLKSGGLPVGV